MKKEIIIFVILNLFQNLSYAQSPNAIPYQAVARNNSGNVIASQNISLRFSIHDGTATGTVVYKETQAVTTNTLGLFSVNIGQGTPVIGTFGAINWASGNKFTQVEMDATGGVTYVDMGTSQMLSVPYALYAATSGSGGSGGATGATGATGVAGTNGTNGAMGATGATGIAGTNGTNGIDGATGVTGVAGDVGPTGAPGSGSVSGTLNYVGKFNTVSTIGNSQIFDNGANVGIGVTSAFGGKVAVLSSTVSTALSSESSFSNGTGITGRANTGSNAWGVYGESSSGYAGYFNGKVQVNGRIQTTNNIGINNVPNYPLSFENTVGDKISFFGSSGPHYGIGIQGGIMQLYTPIPASDIVFGTGQSSSMVTNVTFKGNGNVGIGTTSPAATLHVVRGTSPNGTAQFEGTTHSSHFNYNTSEDTYIRGGKAGSKVFINDVAGTGDVLMATNSGNVGIGTTTPGSKLDVLGDVNFTGNVGSSGAASGFRFDDRSMGATYGWQWYASGGKARLFDQANAADRLVIDNTGNVGIGTLAPIAVLHVESSSNIQTAIISNTSLGTALSVNNTGTGGGIAVNTATSYAGIYANNTSSGTAISANNSGVGTALSATNTGSGNAIEIDGPIKVGGSNKAAFVLYADASNRTDAYTPIINYSGSVTYYTSIIIDNPICNNDPDAIIIVTPNGLDNYANVPSAWTVKYVSGTGKWKISINANGTSNQGCYGLATSNCGGGAYITSGEIANNYIHIGDKWNVLIIKQ